MAVGSIIFPHDFRATRHHEFYVFAGDGHGSLAWVFGGHNLDRPRLTCWHVDHEPECAPYRRPERLPITKDAYWWKWQPAYFVPYEPDL
jgi:hypothetical protein